jgi:hypothetical protein
MEKGLIVNLESGAHGWPGGAAKTAAPLTTMPGLGYTDPPESISVITSSFTRRIPLQV